MTATWFPRIACAALCLTVPWMKAQQPAQAQTAVAPPASHVVPVTNDPGLLAPAPRLRISTAESGASRDPAVPAALPDLSVAGSDGRPVLLSALQPKGYWLLLYRTRDCLPCDRLMNSLGTSGDSRWKNGAAALVLVGDPRAPEIKAAGRKTGTPQARPTAEVQNNSMAGLRSQFAGLTAATWAYDADGTLFQKLQAQGTPTLYGMHGSQIVWRLAGTQGDPAKVDALAANWVSRRDPAAVGTSGDAPTSTSAASAAADPLPAAKETH